MDEFEIILANEKIKSYRFITLIVLLFHLLFFMYLLFDEKLRGYSFLSLVIISIYLILFKFLQQRNHKAFYFNSTVYIFFALFWIETGNVWLFIISLMLGILYHISLQKIKLIINTTGIFKVNLPKKKYAWQLFDNVILKDNFLTLNFKNNHFIQGEIENKVDENAFNLFAVAQLNKQS
ncbi:MAG: hypothetical protein H0W12_01560 [Chitinophagaceae bacterium]|nr:hypothetical protein [Chitinophagaceae bacterium]